MFRVRGGEFIVGQKNRNYWRRMNSRVTSPYTKFERHRRGAQKKHEVGNGRMPPRIDVTEGRPVRWGSNEALPRASSPSMQPGGQPLHCHTAGLARPGPRTERLSANAHCQHNTCALRDTSLAPLLWRRDPLWRQCIRSISKMWNIIKELHRTRKMTL